MKLPNFNTLAMGFLFTIFVVLSLNFLTELVFHIEQPEQKGYAIEVAESSGGSAPAEEEKEDILPLLTTADLSKGEKLIKRCTACHAFEKGGPNKVGPALYGVVGHKIATAAGFGYSGAMKDYGADKTWTFEELDGFLKKPSKWVKGTAMGFAGLKKLEDRANIIAYMNTLSDNPLEVKAADEAKPEEVPAAEEAKPEEAPAAEEAKPEEAPAAEGAKPEEAPAVEEAKPEEAPAAEGAKPEEAPAAQ